MSKVLKIALPVAAVALMVVPGLQPVATGFLGAAFSGTALGAGVTAFGYAAATATIGGIVAIGGAMALQAGAKAVGLGPKVPSATLGQLDRLNASINPNAPRVMVFGSTAMATDIRYVEPSGSKQEYIDYIIGVACHRVEAIREIWFEDRLAWTSAGGVAAYYSGYLSVETRLEGNAGNAIPINGGVQWGASCRLTGCAYIHLRLKRTGNGKAAESPFVSGLASRMTIIGDGVPLYDPRQDSTVPGGSGAMRANDQSTWAFGSIGNNAALAILTYHLGWQINGVASVGLGLPADRIDLASFITAANLCDEPVTLAAGGTEPRYRAAAVIRDSDDPSAALAALLAACNGRLRDDLGRVSLAIMHNDLATAAGDPGLDDGDFLSGAVWDPDPALDATPVVVRGKYVDPSPAALFQPVDYPEVLIADGAADGIDRPLPYDLIAVQSASQAQRIASQVLQRAQYQRRLTATFSNRAWRYRVGDIVPITFSALSMVEKLFRVDKMTFTYDGTCPMELIEENAAIYAWDAGEGAPVEAADPTVYDPRNAPLVLALAEKAQNYRQAGAPSDAREGDEWVDISNGNLRARHCGFGIFVAGTEITIGGVSIDLPWVSVQDGGIAAVFAMAEAAQIESAAALLASADAVAIADGKIDTYYQNDPPSGAGVGDLWFDLNDGSKCYRFDGANWVTAADTRIALAVTAAAGAQATADGKVTTFFATVAPAATAIGDLWYNSSDNILKRWNGASWAATSSLGAPAGTNVGGTDAGTVAAGANAANAGLNGDGTVKATRVGTISMQAGSVSTPLIMSSGTGHSLINSFSTIMSGSLSMADAGVINIFTVLALVFVSGGNTWEVRILVDGTPVDSLGGAATQVGVPIIAQANVTAGSHTIEIQARAATGSLINCATDKTIAQGMMR